MSSSAAAEPGAVWVPAARPAPGGGKGVVNSALGLTLAAGGGRSTVAAPARVDEIGGGVALGKGGGGGGPGR